MDPVKGVAILSTNSNVQYLPPHQQLAQRRDYARPNIRHPLWLLHLRLFEVILQLPPYGENLLAQGLRDFIACLFVADVSLQVRVHIHK